MPRKSVAAVLAFGSLIACGGGEAAPANAAGGSNDSIAPLVVGPSDLATAAARAVSPTVLVSGTLDPADVVQVRAQVSGTVDVVHADRGTSVRRGAILAVIDAQGIRSQVAGATAAVAAAESQAAVTRQRLESARRLHEAGAISAIDFKAAEAAMQAADAQVAAARAGAAAAAEAASRATITSPIDGVVSARFVSGGEAVNPGSPLFTVVNAAELELSGRIGVQDAARVRAGQPVTFALDAFPGESFDGRVARVDPTVELATRQVGVYARLANPGGRLVGGQYAHGRIATGAARAAVVIPESALLERSADAATVCVVAGNRVARRRVTLGPRDEATGLVAVVRGVAAGERVLLNPTPEIADGTPVSLVGDAPSAPPRPDAGK
jgi:RND family efflux transporter MFP subunit